MAACKSRSLFLAYVPVKQSSGAKNAGLPAVFDSSDSGDVAFLLVPSIEAAGRWLKYDTPKSEIFTTPSPESSKFAGLISRWMIP
jgi:hypothetical protein